MKKRGFTLIELIVVMAILSILVLFGLPKYLSYTKDAKLTEIRVQAKELEIACEKYYMNYGDWPRLVDIPFTAEQIVIFGDKILSSTGKVIELESDGNYYDIDYSKISNYIKEPKDSENYILQNPIGSVYHIQGSIRKKEDITKPQIPDDLLTLAEVPIGSIVYDDSWVWEHREGPAYTGTGEIKSIEWLVVAKNHYKDKYNEGIEDHVTLHTTEVIGKYKVDTNQSNRWDNPNGPREWLHTVFFETFSKEFKEKLLTVNIENKPYNSNVVYLTEDKVFIPSLTELSGGDVPSSWVHVMGQDWGFYKNNESRKSNLGGRPQDYRTRTPFPGSVNYFRYVATSGGFTGYKTETSGTYGTNGIRPAVNIKSETNVIEIREGVYKILR